MTHTSHSHAAGDTLRKIRSALLAITVVSLTGTEIELIWLNHLNPILQMIPVFLIAMGIGSIIWFALSRSAKSMRVIQGTMFLCVVAGALGICIHYAWNGSADAKKREVTAPVLAPAALIQIGLVGLAYTFRHPALEAGLIEGNQQSILEKADG